MKNWRDSFWRPLALALTLVMIMALLFVQPTPSMAATYTPPASHRADINLNGTWKFIRSDVSGAQNVGFDDSAWSSVTVPHTWNNLDGEDGGGNYYRGIGWYRRHYTISSASYSGRKFFLQFNGSNLVTDVYFNGTYLGQHQGGYAIFRFEITNYVKLDADNLIAVKVNNAFNADVPPLDADYTFFGGLYRGVHLIVTDKLGVRMLDYGSPGVYLKQTNVSATSANLQVTTRVWNSNTASKSVMVNAVIVDAANNIVQTLSSTQTMAAGTGLDFVQSTTISNPHLWNSQADPYLYHVYVEIYDTGTVVDLVSQPLGFRFYRIDPNNGFFLNGKYLDLHGVDKHQDRLDKGWAISDADVDEDMSLIQEMGANAIRLSHYQHAQRVYDDADKSGLILWSEIPLIDYITNSTAFTNNARQQLIELIRQNYNHPSILFWGIENEILLKPGPDPNPLLTQLNDLAHSEDPTRLTTVASYGPESDASNWHTDLTDFNRYFGWYTGSYNDFAGWADNVHATYPTKDLGVSEYGAGASINFHSLTPKSQDHTEEYQNLFHEAHWQAMKVRPFLWSKFIWNMFDFASDGRNEGDTPGRNDKGLVTYNRKTKKDAFYWYKANWSSSPFVYITSRRFNPRTSATTSIKIYSNTSSVQLILNGVSLGSKTSSNHIFQWSNITLQNGSNTVQAIGILNGTTYTDSITWTLNSTGAASISTTPTFVP